MACSAKPAPQKGRLMGDIPAWPVWMADQTLRRVRDNQINLKKGDKDTAPNGPIQMVQKVLRAWGRQRKRSSETLMAKYGPDGAYGNETKAAVVAFQTENVDDRGEPLATDGIVGDRTLSALDRLVVPDYRPKPYDDTLVVTVDFVIFPDGQGDSRTARALHEANYVFNRVGIKVRKGTVWGPDRTAPKMAQLFDKAKSTGRPTSELTSASVDYDTPEVWRLVRFRPGPPDRITCYHVAPLPARATMTWGITYNTAEWRTPMTIIMPKSSTADYVDIFWHELGHCLLNTKLGDVVDNKTNDHMHDFMGVIPRPGLGKASYPIPPAVAKRMRDVAFLDLS